MGILFSFFQRATSSAYAQTQPMNSRDNFTQTDNVIIISDDEESSIEISSPDSEYSPATTPLSFLSSITTPSPPSSDDSDDEPIPRPNLIPNRRQAARRLAARQIENEVIGRSAADRLAVLYARLEYFDRRR